MLRADTAELRAVVSANHRSGERRRAMAVAADPVWDGPERIEAAGRPVRVVGCRSPLAIRAALVDHGRRAAQARPGDDGAPGELLLILTDCAGTELGLDVRARLVKGDIVPLDPYASVLALFRATVLDPQLVTQRWLVDDLIALAPTDGWPDRQPASGVLDIDLAWRTWHEVRLRVDEPPASLDDVLALGSRPEVAGALTDLPAERRHQLADRWAGGQAGAGDTRLVPVLVDLVAAGRGGDLAVLGLVAQVLWAPTDDPVIASSQAVAKARLEGLFGRDRLDDRAAAAWAEAAVTALRDDPGASGASGASTVLDAAERTLAAADCAGLALLSGQLPLGFEQRLATLGRALVARDLVAAEAALAAVRAHTHGLQRGHRVLMAEAAVRLLRRSVSSPASGTPPPASGFADAVEAYVADGSWVDAACRLLTEGDQVPDLAAAYQSICDEATAQQAARSRRFAGLLAEWSKAEPLADRRFVPVEDLLDRIVAPVATVAPVLLVVCDGLALPVSHDLVGDLWAQGWGSVTPADLDRWPVGVATLPTVTNVSRASLLCGRRVVGGQAEERDGFTTHPALRAASPPTAPPVLWHKAGLVAPNGVALPDEVRRAVADPGQRVVGVVVNSVDDHLSRGDQVRVGWDLLALRPLSWLLDAAAEAGRVVIVTADHGHVLQGPASVSRPHAGGGERWRVTPPPPADDEIEVAGPRVLAGDGRVVLPVDDRLRYGGFKHGYHGGATPDEVLVPVEVLARLAPDGWVPRPVRAPRWWSGQPDRVVPAVTPIEPRQPVVRPSTPSPPSPESVPSPSPSVGTGGGWVAALLASAAFQAHRQRIRLPRPIADDRLRTYLEAIVANGGSIPLAVLASRTGEPPDSLRLALSLVQRLLNLDGSAVLVVQAATVVLNRELADMQFEIAERPA